MADDRFDLRNIHFRELFPWIHLFRGFWLAMDAKKLALGAAGAVLMSLGWWLIAAVFQGEAPAALDPKATPAEQVASLQELARYRALEEASRFPWEESGAPQADPFRSPLNGGWLDSIPSAAMLVIEPLRRLMFPALLMLHSTSTAFVGLLLTGWTLVVWGLFGGAITRIAAVQVARESQIGLLEALRFVFARYLSYLGAPVLPFAGVVVIMALCAVGGLLTHVPILNIVMGAIWFLALLAGLVMAVVLLGLAVSWPLMYASISAEATESFDALSRSYSYVFGRAWHYLFYVVLSVVFGAITSIFVVTVAFVTVKLSQYAVSWGGGEANLAMYYGYLPTGGGWRESLGAPVTGATNVTTASLVGIWTHLLFLGMVGFAYSYFWTASTIIYFLLRRDVDETEIEEVFMEEEEEEPFPTVAPSLGPPPSAPEPPPRETGPPPPPPPPPTLGSLPIVDLPPSDDK